MSDTTIDVRDGLDAFTAKWRARWPEWRIAEAFVPVAQRECAVSWAALRQEITDATWAHRDTRPGDAKLAWWADELQGWSRGARRHPLGVALQRVAAPWATLAAALSTLPSTRERARDPEEASRGVWAMADAIVRIDGALPGASAGAAVEAVSAHLLAVRAACDPASAAPLSIVAEAQGSDSAARWRSTLLSHWPVAARGSTAWRLQCSLARARLQRGDLQAPLGAVTTLATAWRAARG